MKFNLKLVRHWPRIPPWVATLSWAFLLTFGVSIQNAGEYFVSLISLFAACAVIFVAIRHWSGITDSPELTKVLRIGGQIMTVFVLLPVVVIWVLVRKDGHPWSNLSNLPAQIQQSGATAKLDAWKPIAPRSFSRT